MEGEVPSRRGNYLIGDRAGGYTRVDVALFGRQPFPSPGCCMPRKAFAEIAGLCLLALGAVVCSPHPRWATGQGPPQPVVAGDDTSSRDARAGLSVVRIRSTVDDAIQHAYFHAASETAAPLLVVLHSWSADYTQKDPLAGFAIEADWNYIHPDFRGPNASPEACLSEKVIADIDDAITFAIEQTDADPDRIFVCGGSGGGLATLGVYLKSRHDLNTCQAWVPISDLVAWYHQSLRRGNKYAADILASTSPEGVLDHAECIKRSPLYWEIPPRPLARIEIYTGLFDGYKGSVPISHSLRFWNRLGVAFAEEEATIPPAKLVDLLTLNAPQNEEGNTLGEREVVFEKEASFGSITVFDGKHEVLHAEAFARFAASADQDK